MKISKQVEIRYIDSDYAILNYRGYCTTVMKSNNFINVNRMCSKNKYVKNWYNLPESRELLIHMIGIINPDLKVDHKNLLKKQIINHVIVKVYHHDIMISGIYVHPDIANIIIWWSGAYQYVCFLEMMRQYYNYQNKSEICEHVLVIIKKYNNNNAEYQVLRILKRSMETKLLIYKTRYPDMRVILKIENSQNPIILWNNIKYQLSEYINYKGCKFTLIPGYTESEFINHVKSINKN